jgi:hypothetical protein
MVLDAEAVLFNANFTPDAHTDIIVEKERIVRILEDISKGIPVQKYLRSVDDQQVISAVSIFIF